MTHGPDETLLAGSDLQKATDAANVAAPGATVIRAETNSQGTNPYEVHMKKADGSDVTVQLDSNFTVTGTVTGFGPGPAGGSGGGPGGGPGGHPAGDIDDGAASDSQGSTGSSTSN
jgi:hypothetical protein